MSNKETLVAHIHELYDFTVSFFILHPTDKKICLHFHRKLGFWNQLGGHIELDEQPIDAVNRELAEEAGLLPEQYEIVETHAGPKPRNAVAIPAPFSVIIYNYGNDSVHKHIDMPYIIQAKTDVLAPAEGESAEIGWFTLVQMQDMHKEGVLDSAVLDICTWLFDTHM